MRKGEQWVFKANTDHARIEMCAKLSIPVEYVQDVFLHVKDGAPRDRLMADLVGAGLTLGEHGSKPKSPPKDISAYLA
jgi:hypothetical protein